MNDEIKLIQNKGRLIIEWDKKKFGTSVQAFKELLNTLVEKHFDFSNKHGKRNEFGYKAINPLEAETIISVNQDIRIISSKEDGFSNKSYRIASLKPCVGGVSVQLRCHNAREEDMELLLFERPFREGMKA